MTAQPRNRFVFCVLVVEFAVNGEQALRVNYFIRATSSNRGREKEAERDQNVDFVGAVVMI